MPMPVIPELRRPERLDLVRNDDQVAPRKPNVPYASLDRGSAITRGQLDGQSVQVRARLFQRKEAGAFLGRAGR